MKKSIMKAMAVLPLAAVLVSCGRATIDPNDYLEVKYDGLDTAARASFTVDYEQMVKDNLKAFGIKDEDDDHDIERAASKLQKYLGGELDKTKQLSNGDTITFEWDDDKVEKLEKKYKIKLKVEDKSIIVKDLEEAKEFDPFEYITLEYSGVGPDAYAKIKVDSDFPVSYNYFKVTPSSGLSNGDKVKVTFGSSSSDTDYIKEECFEEGYLPTLFEKEFKVDGVQSYISKIDDVEKASYDRMDKYARSEFDKLVKTWEKKKLQDIELVGVNLYTPKDKNAYWGKNALCFVYKVTTNKPEGFKDDKEEEKATEAATEAKTEAATEAAAEAETTAAKAEEAAKAEDAKTTTTTAKDDKKSETTTTTAKADDKKDDKKTDKDTYEYYYFTSFVNVLTPDNKDKDYPASNVQKPEYFNFFGVSGDAFVKGNVLFEGFETLDDLNKAMESKYPSSKCETNIKKK